MESSTSIEKPKSFRSALILSNPHSGRDYSEDFLAQSRLDSLTIRRSEDPYIDEIFKDAPIYGAPLISAQFPRSFVDPNRGPWELDPTMFSGSLPKDRVERSARALAGFGVIPRCVATGENIYDGPIPAKIAISRLERYYHPYHAALQSIIIETKKIFPKTLLIDCHSMPAVGGDQDIDKGESRPDIILGDRYGTSCEPIIMNSAKVILEKNQLKVCLNKPYAGAYTTMNYGNPKNGLNVIQLEINRGLYLNERNITKLESIKELKNKMNNFITELTAIEELH